jgi:23S rRNA (cytidine1920-2'-O)/16S rRNA (cytidine1409-2'-O)-methyltransferase
LSVTGAISASPDEGPGGRPRGKPAGGPRKERLDALLVERGLVENRSRAQAVVLAGAVRVDGEVVRKAGLRVPAGADLAVESASPYVSRAGAKLAHALDVFGVRVSGRDCLDAGASTGGFTDVLLGRGAERVIAVDVGYGQLDWRLRNDGRVVVMERTNVRHLTGEDLPFRPELLVADLSFISLSVALGGLLRTTPEIREAIVLVKPQFEAGPESVGRGGLVRDEEARAGAVLKVAREFESLGFGAVAVTASPVAGRRSGNVEYPLRLVRGERGSLNEAAVRAAVGGAP